MKAVMNCTAAIRHILSLAAFVLAVASCPANADPSRVDPSQVKNFDQIKKGDTPGDTKTPKGVTTQQGTSGNGYIRGTIQGLDPTTPESK